MASCHVAHVAVVMTFLVEESNHQNSKNNKIKKEQHFSQNSQILIGHQIFLLYGIVQCYLVVQALQIGFGFLLEG